MSASREYNERVVISHIICTDRQPAHIPTIPADVRFEFNDSISSLSFHPTNPNLLAVASWDSVSDAQHKLIAVLDMVQCRLTSAFCSLVCSARLHPRSNCT